MGFQTAVRVQPAIGVEGDFSSANPRFTALIGSGGFVAGAAGVTVGRFVWADYSQVDDTGSPAIVNNFGEGPVTGFVGRNQQGLIQNYLQEATMLVYAGAPITVYNGGDFLVKNRGATTAIIGQKAYASIADGSVTFAATGSPSGGTSSASTISAQTNSFNGAIAGNVLTITDTVVGVVVVGTIIAGTGIPASTQIMDQLSGTPNGVGTYALNRSELTVANEAITGSYGTLTVGGSITGTFALNDLVTGSGVAAGTFITQLGTGTGGAGTYFVNLTQTIGSQAINTQTNVETKWIAMSNGLANETIKISDHPLG